MAELIQAQLVAELHTANRGVKAANFQVLWETDCPAVLVEVAFLSNEANRRLLTAYAGRLAASVAITAGLAEYFAA